MKEKIIFSRILFGSLGWVCGVGFALLDSPEKWWMVLVYTVLFFIINLIIDKVYGEDR